MNVLDDLHRLLDRALDDDPKVALVAVRRLRGEIDGWVTDRAVLDARRSGRDWGRIGRLLDMSRQAARKRFGHLDAHRSANLPISELPGPDHRPSEANAGNRQTLGYLANQRRRLELDEWEKSGIDIVPW